MAPSLPSIAVTLLLALGLALGAIYMSRLSATEPPPNAAGPTRLLIVSGGRSGSTLTGELFRQSSDIMYFYEPCRGGHGRHEHRRKAQECAEYLTRLTRCDITSDDLRAMAADEPALANSSPAVARTLRGLSSEASSSVIDRMRDDLVGSCKSSKAVVAKTIRVPEIYPELAEDPGLRIVLLVRDPRATVRSQLASFSDRHKKQERLGSHAASAQASKMVCDNMLRRLEGVDGLGSTRCRLLRYEDATAALPDTTAALYQWAGLGVPPPTVTEWLDEHMHATVCPEGAGKVAAGAWVAGAAPSPEWLEEQRQCAIKAYKNKDGGKSFTTGRNTAVMADLWRHLVDPKDAKEMWEICNKNGLMDRLHYSL